MIPYFLDTISVFKVSGIFDEKSLRIHLLQHNSTKKSHGGLYLF